MTAYKKAKLAINHRPEIKEAFEEVSKLPKLFIQQFLDKLEENPQHDANELLDEVTNAYKSWKSPYASEGLNEGLNHVRFLGASAEREFIETLEILGDTADPIRVAQSIAQKHTKPKTLDHYTTKYKMDAAGLIKHFGIRTGNSYNDQHNLYSINGKHFSFISDALAEAEFMTTAGSGAINQIDSQLDAMVDLSEFSSGKPPSDDTPIRPNNPLSTATNPQHNSHADTGKPSGTAFMWATVISIIIIISNLSVLRNDGAAEFFARVILGITIFGGITFAIAYAVASSIKNREAR